MVRDLLINQLNQELIAAAQMAYLAGISKNPSLRKQLLEFAKAIANGDKSSWENRRF